MARNRCSTERSLKVESLESRCMLSSVDLVGGALIDVRSQSTVDQLDPGRLRHPR